jgi:hypothetical protein
MGGANFYTFITENSVDEEDEYPEHLRGQSSIKTT